MKSENENEAKTIGTAEAQPSCAPAACSTTSRFNFRGNRPRMGKRGMCGACGQIVCLKVSEGDTCPACGQPSMSDVSYDD